MGWFLNLVRPKIKSKQDSAIPENLWKVCPQCSEMIFMKEWESSLFVCSKCNFHDKMDAISRIHMISDSLPKWITPPNVKDDPIKFIDQKSYKDRLKEARLKTGQKDASIGAECIIEGNPATVFAMDFSFIGGSMGTHVGATFIKCIEHSISKNIPLVAITASGGARMQEGILSLMQMPKTVMGRQELSERGIPYIVILTNPTTGGVIASFAMLGDITIAEPGALIGFTGPRVIEETMGIKLPKDFQSAEFQKDHGFVDCIIPRNELKKELGKAISLLAPKKMKARG